MTFLDINVNAKKTTGQDALTGQTRQDRRTTDKRQDEKTTKAKEKNI